MKKSGNKQLKIVAATSMAIFSLMSVFMGTFAWFESMRENGTTSNDFKVEAINTTVQTIEIHKYLGEYVNGDDKSFGFDPNPYATVSFDENGNPVIGEGQPYSIELDPYSTGDPHHPVLLLFSVEGHRTTLRAKTDSPYMALSKDNFRNKDGEGHYVEPTVVATKDLLAAKAATAEIGEYFEVTSDSSYSAYYTDDYEKESTPTYITTRYKYVGNDEFELVWTDLGLFDNALSSVVNAFSFVYEDDPDTDTRNIFHYDEDGDRLPTATSDTCIFIDEDDCVTDTTAENYNMSTFAEFNADSSFKDFKNETTLFDGYVDDVKYVGIVIDYNSEALQDIFSNYLGHAFLNHGLGFVCDWTTII